MAAAAFTPRAIRYSLLAILHSLLLPLTAPAAAEPLYRSFDDAGAPPALLPGAPTRQIAHGSHGPVINPDNHASIHFDGKSRLAIPAPGRPDAFTAEAFIRVGAHHDYPLLVGKVRDPARNSATWSLSVSGGKLRARFDTYPADAPWPPPSGFNQTFGSGVNIEDGQWHHAALTYSNQIATLYLDYQPRATGRTAHPIAYTDGPILLGDGAGEGPFTGWIDELRVTPAALEPHEFLRPPPATAPVRDEWHLQRGTAIPAAAAWDEWIRTDRILRRQAAQSQPAAPERRARLTALKARLDTLTHRNAESIHTDIRALKREALLGDTQLDFTSILCIDNPYAAGSEASHEIRHRTENCAVHGGRLLLIGGLDPDSPTRALAPAPGAPPAAFWRPDLSFDAATALFCMKPQNETAYHLYETALDGTRTRQITRGDYNDLDPIHTPDGTIIFTTSRCNQYLRCGDSKFRMFTLARCDPAGRDLYFISANCEADFTPALLPDGRILYTRWEYVDREVNRIQSLWTVNPDGTAATAHWGNQSRWPDMQLNARPIPGTTRLLLHAPGHHAIYEGPLAIIDPAEGNNYPHGIRNLTPHIPWAEVGPGPRDRPHNPDFSAPRCYQAFQTPYPISPDLFLTSARSTGRPCACPPGHCACPPAPFKLYLMDYDGNMELLHAGQHNILHAQPVRPAPSPPPSSPPPDGPAP